MSRAEPLKSAAALVFLSATGEPLETHRGAFTDRGFEAYTVAVDEADQPVVLSMTSHDGSSKRTLLSRFASDGTVLGEVELEFPEGRGALALAEVPVVAGFDLETEKLWVAKIDPATGTPIWQTELAAPSYMDVSKIAVGPAPGPRCSACRHAAAVSRASAGRTTCRPGIIRMLISCSIGWCVGPSSPTQKLSWLNTWITGARISADSRSAPRMKSENTRKVAS